MLQTISQAEDVALIEECEQAVVLLFANWSGPCLMGRNHLLEAASRLTEEQPAAAAKVRWFEIDVSQQNGALWERCRLWLRRQQLGPESRPEDSILSRIRKWWQRERLDHSGLMGSGSGPILWCRSGNVVRYRCSAAGVAAGELLEDLHLAFQATDGPGVRQGVAGAGR